MPRPQATTYDTVATLSGFWEAATAERPARRQVPGHEATIDDRRNRVNIVERSNRVYDVVRPAVCRADGRGVARDADEKRGTLKCRTRN